MSRIIDARGLNCPEPVILTKRAMEDDNKAQITTIVDNDAAVENVSKLARSQGYELTVEKLEAEVRLHMVPGQELMESPVAKDAVVAILIKSSLFGEGDPELGGILMKSFLFSLNELDGKVAHLIFMNSGVKLTTVGSPVLEHLQALEQKGIEVLSCGTCLDFYGVKDKLMAGKVTNMYTAVEILTGADRVLTI
ncbi:MAG: sulfurtransferase-like selenium metabolism protein YedF [Deltaproteobacteria bacterium]